VNITVSARIAVKGPGSDASSFRIGAYFADVIPARISGAGYTYCAGPLRARDHVGPGVIHRVEFDLTSWPDRLAALVFGTTTGQTRIPGSSCLLLVEPVAVLFAMTGSGGEARWEVALPGPITSATVYTQAAVLVGTSVVTTDRLRVQFRD
jgi:hypothetical protein